MVLSRTIRVATARVPARTMMEWIVWPDPSLLNTLSAMDWLASFVLLDLFPVVGDFFDAGVCSTILVIILNASTARSRSRGIKRGTEKNANNGQMYSI